MAFQIPSITVVWGCVRTLARSLWPDVRSAGVGAVVGVVISLGVQWYHERLQTKFYIMGATTGVGSPALLFDLASNEGEVKITFNPEAVKQAKVCEYAAYRGRSYWDITFDYLKEHSSCFVMMMQKSEEEFEIRPNKFSGAMRLEQGQFLCNCPK